MKMISSDSNRRTFAFISLGCPKNLVDSERMLGKLAQDGYVLQPDAQGADVVVVNTCGFIEPARQESLAVIREMLELKQQGKIGSVVVAGCLAERQLRAASRTGAGGRSDCRSLWTGRDRRSSRPSHLAPAGTTIALSAGPRACSGRYCSTPHHAPAFCLLEDFRRLRSTLHLLRRSPRCAANTSPSRWKK